MDKWKIIIKGTKIDNLKEDIFFFVKGDTQSKSFFLKQLQCELCKTPFPSAVILNGERVPVVSIPKIEAPYIILENICGVIL
jgi:hypothetical protein